jgi:DNA-binding beta-propeller fold protein YncE
MGSYGEGPGQFVYPTDVLFGPNGRLYVSEYGGHDRVQVFDVEGAYLFEFGHHGPERDGFNRPQSMALGAGGTEIYIADACNHRIVVTDLEGNVLRLLGEAGRGQGDLLYPFGITVLPDDTLLVVEFENHRVQQLTPQGESLGIWGGLGNQPGRLQSPWAIDHDGSSVFILDSRNNRAQVMPIPVEPTLEGERESSAESVPPPAVPSAL